MFLRFDFSPPVIHDEFNRYFILISSNHFTRIRYFSRGCILRLSSHVTFAVDGNISWLACSVILKHSRLTLFQSEYCYSNEPTREHAFFDDRFLALVPLRGCSSRVQTGR